MDVTVIICTYNGASRLPQLFKHLTCQLLTSLIDWEIVVVDNNSQDETVQVVQNYQLLPEFTDKLQYCFEPKQGLAFARRCAAQVACGELLAFLDDDNLPNPYWVQAVYDFGQQHPNAGAFGGQIVGVYEGELPYRFERIACFLAVIDRGQVPFRYDLLGRWLFPAGAGLVVRRQAWSVVPQQPALSGVSGESLVGKGEDIETLSYIRKEGWQIWHNPAMEIGHEIGCDRTSPAYLFKLFRGVGLSRHHTRMIRFQAWQKPLAIVGYVLKDFIQLIIYCFTHYHLLRSDLVTQCELVLLFNSLLSPFYCFLKTFKVFEKFESKSFISLGPS
ncbi:MAG: hormogonium polysaccharide biosynthesis glycosyltransferase HpsE [Cyanobacteria bacterium P01_F01_bin.116]